MSKRWSKSFTMPWATYALGHDLRWLENWHIDVWRLREMSFEGAARFNDYWPEKSVEVLPAIEAVVGELGIDARRGLKLGRSLEQWKWHARHLLREITPRRWSDSEIDWETVDPPGVDELRLVRSNLAEAVKESPHLQRWYQLGETSAGDRVEEIRHVYLGRALSIHHQLAALYREGKYDFIPPLLPWLRRLGSGGEPKADDPIPRIPTPMVFDSYLRHHLKKGRRPEPAIQMDNEGVTFAGERFSRKDFHPAEWKIFQALCSQPRTQVKSVELAGLCGLAGPEAVPPQVSRIRRRLRPALQRQLNGEELDSDARNCYLVSWEFREKPPSYSLELDAMLVVVAGSV